MSFIQVNLGEDVIERKNVPAGDYSLVITDISEKPAQSGSAMLTVVHGIEGEIDAQAVKHWITLPTEGDDAETVRNKSLGLKRYLVNAGIDFDAEGFNTDELLGHSFSGALGVDMIDTDRDGNPIDKPYEKNTLIVPFLQDEQAA